jgi:hypothetical protein
LFSFFTTFEVNFLRLVADLKKGKWGKNISEHCLLFAACSLNRQQTAIEKYLRNKGKIAVITFCKIKFFPSLTSWGNKL